MIRILDWNIQDLPIDRIRNASEEIEPHATINGPPFGIGPLRQLRSWRNYGQVRNTSDHLALAMDL